MDNFMTTNGSLAPGFHNSYDAMVYNSHFLFDTIIPVGQLPPGFRNWTDYNAYLVWLREQPRTDDVDSAGDTDKEEDRADFS